MANARPVPAIVRLTAFVAAALVGAVTSGGCSSTHGDSGAPADAGGATPDGQSGGRAPGDSGCNPTTCQTAGAGCGAISNGCGNTLQCGACAAPTTCGGGGTANQCGGGGTSTSSLLITESRLADLKNKVTSNAPEWKQLVANLSYCEAAYGSNKFDPYSCSPENPALAYLLTGKSQYAADAYNWLNLPGTSGVPSSVPVSDCATVRGDDYLEIGDYTRAAAMVLNYCYAALSQDQRDNLTSFLERWMSELWAYNPKDSTTWGYQCTAPSSDYNCWGLGWSNDVCSQSRASADLMQISGNNYHAAFLEGTAFSSYALQAAGGLAADNTALAAAKTYLSILTRNMEQAGGVMDYLNHHEMGGDWEEGVNYGERSKERLYRALAVIASMGGTNYFDASPYFADSIYYAIYQLQPNRSYIYPGGDVTLESLETVSPYERDYMQVATFWVPDVTARGYGQWYLDTIPGARSYANNSDGSGGYAWLDFMDVIFKLADTTGVSGQNTPTSETNLPLSYHAVGTHWINVRSDWTANATSLSISGAPEEVQSHAHDDSGSFCLFKQDWMTVDSVVYSKSGTLGAPGAHNMVTAIAPVMSETSWPAVSPGLMPTPSGSGWQFYDDASYSYVQVDGTNMNNTGDPAQPMLSESTRELVFLKPDALVIYDRVAPAAGTTDYAWRLHFPVKPTGGSGAYSVTYKGGGLSMFEVVGGVDSVASDSDLESGETAWRVQEATPTDAAAGRYLNVVQVATGPAPTFTASHVTTSGAMEGVLWQGSMEGATFPDQAVLFSTRPRGDAATTSIQYTVPSTTVVHTLANMSGSYEISTTTTGASTTVTIQTGSTTPANSQGVLRFTTPQ